MNINFNDLILNKKDNSYIIVDYIGNEELLKIPTRYNNLPITIIDSLSTSDNNITTKVFIPGEVVINERVFINLNNLEEIVVSDNNELYSSNKGVLYSKGFKDLLYYPNGKKNKKYKTNNKTRTIGLSFYSNQYLKKLILSNNLRSIYFDSFLYLDNLKKIVINNDYFKSFKGALYDYKYEILYKYPNNHKYKKLKIKENVNYVSPAAFIKNNI